MRDIAGFADVSRETLDQLHLYVDMLIEENDQQNLIARSTVQQIWSRHIQDGAQLVKLGRAEGSWCDVGSGPGLPGIVIAIISGQPMTLIEPRRRRVEFLERVKERLTLDNVSTVLGKAESVVGQFDMLTARAVASLPKLLPMCHHLSHPDTLWLLPKGEKAKSELDEARASWQGSFRLVESQTNPEASIVVASGVRPRGKV